MIIEGEVGVGKTALMRQIFGMDHRGEALEIYANCYGAESDVPLRAFRDCFQCLERLHGERRISLSGKEERLIRRMTSGEGRTGALPLREKLRTAAGGGSLRAPGGRSVKKERKGLKRHRTI